MRVSLKALIHGIHDTINRGRQACEALIRTDKCPDSREEEGWKLEEFVFDQFDVVEQLPGHAARVSLVRINSSHKRRDEPTHMPQNHTGHSHLLLSDSIELAVAIPDHLHKLLSFLHLAAFELACILASLCTLAALTATSFGI